MRQFILSALCLTVALYPTELLKSQSYQAISYQLSIQGTSTLNSWTSTVKNVSVQGDFEFVDGALQKIRSGTVQIMTKSIESDIHSSLMDERTHQTLKADRHPSITYRVLSVKSVQKTGAETFMIVYGTLTIGGVSKRTNLQFKTRVLSDGKLEITGSKKIIMSDYGITPPVFMLGALRVADEVTITYEVQLQKSPSM
jgi:polyisoprenoid-binding protein YceI